MILPIYERDGGFSRETRRKINVVSITYRLSWVLPPADHPALAKDVLVRLNPVPDPDMIALNKSLPYDVS